MLEFIAPIVNFSVVVFVLWYFGRKPCRQFLQARSTQTATAIREAEAEARQSDGLLAAEKAKWNGVEAETRELSRASDERLEVFRQKAKKHAELELERVDKEARLFSETEMGKAQQELVREVARRSVRGAEQYIERNLNESTRQKMIIDTMEILGDA
jgi:F0F1-type ATP synthase membrane subunit b/b'